jgi:ABC-type branched-subunit amino acid transport system substrate-binding protein
MAIEDFGGTMFGKPIELVSADPLNKPDVAASMARKWWETEGVDMIVGGRLLDLKFLIYSIADRGLVRTFAQR